MEITPTSLAQVQRGRDGREYEVSGLAGDIARQVQELDASLRTRFNESGGYFVIYQLLDQGRFPVTEDHLATRKSIVMRVPAHQWDGRVMRALEPRAHEIRNGVSAAARLDAGDARRDADIDYRAEQEGAAGAGRLLHALERHVLGVKPRAFISRGLPA